MSEIKEMVGLIEALASESMRFEAADTLISHGGTAVEPLLGALKSENWEIRGNAAWTLGKIGDRRAVGPLIEALDDEVPEVRATAGRAIISIGTPAVESLVRFINSGRPKSPGLASGILSALSKT